MAENAEPVLNVSDPFVRRIAAAPRAMAEPLEHEQQAKDKPKSSSAAERPR